MNEVGVVQKEIIAGLFLSQRFGTQLKMMEQTPNEFLHRLDHHAKDKGAVLLERTNTCSTHLIEKAAQ